MKVGEGIETLRGASATVTRVVPSPRTESVYNLEVHRAKSYYVASQALLAHNTCLTSNPVQIANRLGHTLKDVNNAIHKAKEFSKFGGSRKNPDVLVDIDTGDIFIKDPATGNAAELIDNIFDYLPEP